MFLHWKNQYCQNDCTTQGISIDSECNPYEITNGIFHRTKTPKFSMETHKILSSQSNLEKEKQRNQASGLQGILQSYSHQNSTVVV